MMNIFLKRCLLLFSITFMIIIHIAHAEEKSPFSLKDPPIIYETMEPPRWAIRWELARTFSYAQRFEESIAELETIVQNLEQGEATLEDSMALFERGLKLSQVSQTKLKDAEQKIDILLRNPATGEAQLQPFQVDTDS